MSTPEQPTCGKGLAENSVLPGRVSELISAMADNLENHMPALDLNDQKAMTHPRVREAFETFVEQKRALLSLLNVATERDEKLLETMRVLSRKAQP